MQSQININTMRILLAYRGDKLTALYNTGRIPLGVQPHFCENEGAYSAAHDRLRTTLEIEELAKERLDIIKDCYVYLLNSLGYPSNLHGVVRENNLETPVTLINNDFHAAKIVFPNSILDPVELQSKVALQLIASGIKLEKDADITGAGCPSFIISLLPSGSDFTELKVANTYTVDLPYYPHLIGIKIALITILRKDSSIIDMSALLGEIKTRVDQ